MGTQSGTLRWLSLRSTRRRLILFGSFLVAACRRTDDVAVPLSPTAVPTVTVPPTSAPVTVPTPRPAVTPTPRMTPTSRPNRIFVRSRLDEPRSHDFNADADCGGEPELFAGLVRLTSDYDVRPEWAERWDVSADGTRWVFTLRRTRAGWSNGDPVRATDFVWSWRRLLDPAHAAPQAALLDLIGGAQEVRAGLAPPESLAVRALDEWTLEVELVRPAGYLPWILGTPGLLPAHRASVERFGAAWTEAGNCVSNGPFRLVSWERGAGYVLSSNPYYWDRSTVSLESCTVTIAQGDNPLLPFFQGRVDFAAVPSDRLPEVTSDEALLVRLQQSVLPETWFLVVQPDTDLLGRVELRRALSWAIDRERLRQLLYGAVAPAWTLVPPGIPGHLGDSTVLPDARFAPFEAYRAWEEIRGPGRATLRLTAPAACSGEEETILRDVVGQLARNLGVPVEVERLQGDAWERVVTEGSFQLLWWRWRLPFPDAAAVYDWLFSRERTALRGLRWGSDEFERLIVLARGEVELARRLGAYRQCELLVQRACVAIPVVHPVATFLVQPWVVGLPRTRDGMVLGPGALFSRFLSSVVLGSRMG
ncbi:MAG: ABC transporter substrate-binding protein [Thermomicrobium sp.]|nr:ABC transporter substrate-binding protein [Thermomicrobium sp.]